MTPDSLWGGVASPGNVMKWLWFAFALAGFLVRASGEENPESTGLDQSASGTIALLETTDGRQYRNCIIKRVEEDGLIVQHDVGVVRISFFDLPASLQRAHDFDPVAAMQKRKEDLARNREWRWERFWKTREHEAALAEERAREQLRKKARLEWIPVEATVVRRIGDGAFVRAKKIEFVPTKVRSVLGFERDGPLRKTLVPFSPDVIFIEGAEIRGRSWLGYVEPFANGTRAFPPDSDKQVASHRAVARTEFP